MHQVATISGPPTVPRSISFGDAAPIPFPARSAAAKALAAVEALKKAVRCDCGRVVPAARDIDASVFSRFDNDGVANSDVACLDRRTVHP